MSVLRIEGYPAPLPTTALRMMLVNPMFAEDILEGSYSLPINLPATEPTRAFLNWLDDPTVFHGIVTEFNASYEEDDNVIVSGKLIVKKASLTRYDMFLTTAIGELASIKELSLREVDMGEHVVVPDTQTLQYEWTGGAPGPLWFISYKLSTYLNLARTIFWNTDKETTLDDLVADINTYWSVYLGMGNVPGVSVIASRDGLKVNLVFSRPGSWPKFDFDIASFGLITLTSTNLNDTTLSLTRWLALMNATIASPSDYPFVFGPVKNKASGMMDTTVDPAVDLEDFWQNKWDFTTGEFLIEKPATGNDDRTVTPFPKVKHILTKIFEAVGLRVSLMLNGYEERIFLYSIYAATFSLSENENINNYVDYNGRLVDIITMKDLMPNKTVNDFLNTIRNVFCASFIKDEATKTIKIQPNVNLILSDEIDDWTSKVVKRSTDIWYGESPTGFSLKHEPDGNDKAYGDGEDDLSSYNILEPVQSVSDLLALQLTMAPVAPYDFSRNLFSYGLNERSIVLVKENNWYYKPVWIEDPHWPSGENYIIDGFVKAFKNNQGVTTGDGSTEISTGADCVLTEETVPIYPVTKQKLNWRSFYSKRNASDDECGIRFMWYHGMFNNPATSVNYPFLSSEDYDSAGGTVGPIDGWSFNWASSSGLYERFWRYYVQMRENSEEVEMMIDISYADYTKINLHTKKRIDGILYFIKNVDITFPIKGPARVLFVKCAKVTIVPTV